jgi:adenine-specific DNA-methyltransferase
MIPLRFETPDLSSANIEKIAALFPSCITEALDEEKSTSENKVYKKAVNFEALKTLLGGDNLSGSEVYEFTWVGKKASIIEANRPIRKTLRPYPGHDKDESRDWDTTQNLYIEGDNMEVLKLLQESYLGKIKMIYIDPPYNTGNDFVYRDDFRKNKDDYDEETGVFDEEGDRLFRNKESNGRFHSDWCSMIYPRLLLARNLLRDDGVIFISIDDNEVAQLRKIGDEVFGEGNFVGQIVIKSNPRGSMSDSTMAQLHEYLIVYAKNIYSSAIIGHLLTGDMLNEYKFEENGNKYRLLGLRQRGGFWRRSERPNLFFPIYISPNDCSISIQKTTDHCVSVFPIQPSTGEDGTWRWGKEKIRETTSDLIAKTVDRNGSRTWDVFQKDWLSNDETERRTKAKSLWDDKAVNYQNGTTELKNLIGSDIFDYAKPLFLLIRTMEMIKREHNDIILDFFSGSATTAHAVMQLNAEDGGNRKFIMVQLPESCDKDSEAFKAGYKNICEIGKERIRRAGNKIRAEAGLNRQNLDIGFRVFKVADSNMKDVYYGAGEYKQEDLDLFVSNIKEDRTALDLLYGCLLDWGLTLDLPHTEETIDGFTVHVVYDVNEKKEENEGAVLAACFDENISEKAVMAIAKKKPLRAVFRDAGFASDPAKINVFEIFKRYAPDTQVKVI